MAYERQYECLPAKSEPASSFPQDSPSPQKTHRPAQEQSGSPTTPPLYLWIEFALLFLGLPLVLYTQREALESLLMPLLVLLAAGCAFTLWRDGSFERRQLWNRAAFQQHLRRTLRWFVPGALVVGGAFALLRPDLLLTFPRFYPEVWLVILVTYPLLSVYPQEVIFRAFLFHRYDALFPSRWGKVTASGLTFGFAHIVFANWVAPAMTAVMGIQFALTYARTESTLQVTLEHGLWGLYAFTVGLGWFVYSGAI
jgi:membrane protease YdiL (CAAX protease family)